MFFRQQKSIEDENLFVPTLDIKEGALYCTTTNGRTILPIIGKEIRVDFANNKIEIILLHKEGYKKFMERLAKSAVDFEKRLTPLKFSGDENMLRIMMKTENLHSIIYSLRLAAVIGIDSYEEIERERENYKYNMRRMNEQCCTIS